MPTFLSLLVAKGGPVVLVVLVASSWMWALIAERYWFVHRRYPALREAARRQWRHERPDRRGVRGRLREARAAALSAALMRHFGTIRALAAILPLLGLLGTVTGMITTFELMTVFGTANPRELSRGIDRALVSTISGLVTAISGLYFSSPLENRALRERDRLSGLLV